MAWLFLILSGLFEVVWAVSVKYTQGFTKVVPSVIMIIAAVISFYLLSAAQKTIPVGTSYAVFAGIGAVGAAAFGMIWLGESRDVLKLLCISLVIVGIVGLKFICKE